MPALAIIQLITVLVQSLEGEGGQIVRQLLGLAEKEASNQTLTAEERAYCDQQATAAVARMDASAQAALFQR